MRRLLLFVPLLFSLAPPARAQGFQASISWDACPGAGANDTKVISCATNDSTETVAISFVPNLPVPGFRYLSATLLMLNYGGELLPDWWQFINPGSCRQNALTVSTAPGLSPGECSSAWSGQPQSTLTYWTGRGRGDFENPSFEGSLHVELMASQTTNLQAGVPHEAFKVVISNEKTVGSGACAGGCKQVDIMLAEIYVVGYNVQVGGPRSWWGYGLVTLQPVDACVVAARTPTWGAIKSLYR
jgi:hypothetical protein